MVLNKKKSINYKELSNYIAVFGLIAVSGIPFFTPQPNMIPVLVFSLFIFLKRSIIFDTRVLGVMFIFYAVDLAQVFILKPFVLQTVLGTYIRLFMCYFVIAISGTNFTKYYSNIIYYLSIIGLAFYIPSVLSHSFYFFFAHVICPKFISPFAKVDEFYEAAPTFIIYTFHEVLLEYRNSGPFWEPGAYAIFIIIAMIFNLINDKLLWTKKNIVLSIALLTTLSTSGFIAFFILIIFYYLTTGDLVKNLLIMSLALPLGTFLYFNLDFLNKKIQNNIEIAGDDKSSRFGSGLADLKDFATSPWIGWGKGAMRYGGKKFTFFTADQHRNNGITNLLAGYGIFLFSWYFYNYYKTLRVMCIANSFNKHFAALSFFVILLLGFSQTIFQYPFFYGLIFVHLVYTKGV